MFGRNKKPKKPETLEEQVEALWNTVHNHLWSKVNLLDWKLNFLVLLNIALITVILIK